MEGETYGDTMEGGTYYEDFHQQEDLTTRLNNILREYPPGIGPFQEMLQNADDAGATRFVVVYDTQQYSTDKVLPLLGLLCLWFTVGVCMFCSSCHPS